jgi:methyl-accepting chemotaxis protein
MAIINPVSEVSRRVRLKRYPNPQINAENVTGIPQSREVPEMLVQVRRNKERNVKNGAKLAIIGVGLFVGVTIALTQDKISHLVDEQVQSVVRENGEKISKWFGEYMAMARTLGQVMEGYKSIPPTERREYFNILLKQTLLAHPELTGVYTNWVPDALGGMDADYVTAFGTDENGCFIPNWSNVDGELPASPIVGFSWERILQLNITTDYIEDPIVYLIGEKKLLITNMVIPVKDNGVLMAGAGIALGLSRVQAIVSDIKPFGDGRAMLFNSDGLVIAHPDPKRLGMDMENRKRTPSGHSLP